MPTPSGAKDLAVLHDEVVACRRCPRLVEWREHVAANPRASFRDEVYWGHAVPGFGDPDAAIMLVGLAPAAHGANRTGRMFTGDRSGDWLYAALHRAGLANRPTATARDDGLALLDTYVTAAVHCAPPGNKPTTEERDRCAPYLSRELDIFEPRVIVVLGGFGYQALWRVLAERGSPLPKPRPPFGHGVEIPLDVFDGATTVLCSYHPSQQNTFTGRLTEGMLDDIFGRAVELAGP